MAIREQLARLGRFFFGSSARTFGWISLVFLVSLAIAPAKDYFSESRHYQHQYLKLISRRADAVTLEKRFAPGVHQIWIPALNVTDRCTSCHVALKETSLEGVNQAPFRPHSPIPHTLTQFGCVVCHRGQGPATTVKEAHYTTLAWEQPLLPARYLQSSCGQCHFSALPGTPELNSGRQLVAGQGCVRCHLLKQPDGTAVAPADDPPSLAHLMDKTTREWLYAWIRNPQAYSSTETMPNFGFNADDTRDVVDFLAAQSTAGVAAGQQTGGTTAAPAQQAKAQPDLQAGASLYGQLFCASCHATQNPAGMLVGGNYGPELTRIGTKAKPEWLAAWLKNPRAYDPQARMPHYRLTDQQIGLLVGFLQSKTDSDLLANVQVPEATSTQITHGKSLVTDYGCASCHQINGIKKPENFAPDLSRVGSRSLALLAFAPGVPHTLPDYIAAKIRNPRAFGPSLKMPKPALADAQADEVTTALLALTDRANAFPDSLRIPAAAPSHYEPADKAGDLMRDMQCFDCHAINGRGGDMAPDLSWEGSSVQRAWLVAFLKNPGTLRPALIRRMPKFNLSDAEAATLSDYIMTVYQTPAFDRDSVPASALTPAAAEQGRQLFYTKYACQSCHIANFQTDKGYIGPALAQAGLRLNAAWVYHWLKDPQALRPGTIEPRQNISDDEALKLSAFVMSLKSAKKP